MFQVGTEGWERHRLCRDYLRQNPLVAKEQPDHAIGTDGGELLSPRTVQDLQRLEYYPPPKRRRRRIDIPASIRALQRS